MPAAAPLRKRRARLAAVASRLASFAREDPMKGTLHALVRWGIGCGAAASLGLAPFVGAAEEPLPVLEAKIPLGPVRGRLDHFALDAKRHRLFIAELANDSIGVVDLGTHTLLRQIEGVQEPQGVGFVDATDTLYVASGGDGALHLFSGADLAPSGTIALGSDADNVRVDAASGRVYVGYGSGAIGVIDAAARRKIADLALRGHPEGFQLDASRGRIAVNVPEDGATALIDLASGRALAAWRAEGLRANYPMALDAKTQRVIVAFRRPSRLVAFAEDGTLAATLPSCGDADDVFVDARRDLVYVSCGEGTVDVVGRRGSGYERVGRVPTAAGARTSLLLPDADRLVVAVPASPSQPAAVWIYRLPARP
jgi:DNA-binding beta-propeller fold protein YncE